MAHWVEMILSEQVQSVKRNSTTLPRPHVTQIVKP